jgi:flagellar motor switch protein FliN/FliY
VTTALSSTATELLAAAGGGVIGTLATAEPLRPGEPTHDAATAELDGTAILAPFTGSATGELLLIVDAQLGAALRESAVGDLDVRAALDPALQAASAAVGTITLGPAQELDPKLALHRVFGHDDAALLPLHGTSGVQAVIALGVDAPTAPAEPAAAPADRLDLLRGVEMAATAELGRARMTVNDLLTLRAGAVIELDRSAGAPADLYVNGRLIARGEVVVVDENYGLRITQVVTDDTAR